MLKVNKKTYSTTYSEQELIDIVLGIMFDDTDTKYKGKIAATVSAFYNRVMEFGHTRLKIKAEKTNNNKYVWKYATERHTNFELLNLWGIMNEHRIRGGMLREKSVYTNLPDLDAVMEKVMIVAMQDDTPVVIMSSFCPHKRVGANGEIIVSNIVY